MRSGRITKLVCACAGGALLVGAARQDDRPQVIERLLSKDPVQVNQARDELLSARRDLIGKLKRIVEDPNNRAYKGPSVEAAIFLLGEMRAIEAVEVLADHIAWPVVQKPDERPHPPEISSRVMVTTLASFRRWPSVAALVKIGEPSVDPVFRRLIDTRTELELKAHLSVLIWLRDRDYILGRLNQLLSKAPDPEHRLMLEQALHLVTNEPPVDAKSPEWRPRKN